MTSTFPALAIQPQQGQQVDPLGQMGKMIALRSNMLQLQQQQMQMQSQQAMMDAFTNSGGDYDKAGQAMLQSGKVLPGQYFQFQQMAMQHKLEVANLTKAQNENEQTWGYNLQKQLAPIAAEPDPAKQAQMWTSTTQAIGQDSEAAIKYGPQAQAIANMPYPGSPDAVKVFQAHLQGQQKMLADAQELAKTREENANARMKELEASMYTASPDKFDSTIDTITASLPPTQAADFSARYKAGVRSFLSVGDPKGAMELIKQAQQEVSQFQLGPPEAAAKAAAEEPYQERRSAIEASVHANIERGTQMDLSARRYAEAQMQPYYDTLHNVDMLNSAVDQAKAGNLTAMRAILGRLTGVAIPPKTGKLAVKEFDTLAKQGNIPDQWAGTIKKIFTGDQFTDQMESDMKAYGNTVAADATNDANRRIGGINKLYNSSIGQLPAYQPPAAQRPAAAAPTLPRPAGATGTAPGADGKLHWVNKNTRQDLGPAQ